VTFTITSNFPLADPKVREYHRFSDAADDMVEVRIYQGIHFRSADEAARREGTRVAHQAFNNFLRPRRDHDRRDRDHGRDDNHDDDHHDGRERDR
jgi:hypothetical protein